MTKYAQFQNIKTDKSKTQIGRNTIEIEKLRKAEAYNLFIINTILHARKSRVAFSRELDNVCYASVIQNGINGLSTSFRDAQEYKESVLKVCNITSTQPIHNFVAH